MTEPVDISPAVLKKDAEAVQEIMSRHIGDQCQCDGLGPASYGIARYIAKRIAALQPPTERGAAMWKIAVIFWASGAVGLIALVFSGLVCAAGLHAQFCSSPIPPGLLIAWMFLSLACGLAAGTIATVKMVH